MVEGIFDVTVSTADRMATRGVPMDDLGEEIDGVLDDVALGIEIRQNVDGRIGDEQRLGISRHIHDEDVADPPRGAQAGLSRGHRAHQLVGVQAALHQELALGLANQLDALCRGRLAVRHVDDLIAVDGKAMLAGHAGDFGGRPHQDRDDDPGLCRFDRPAQRGFVARMHDDRRRRGNLLRSGDQPLVLAVRRRGERTERRNRSDVVFVSRHHRVSASAV